MIRHLAATGLAALMLSACSQPGGDAQSAAGDPYAGLDPEILAWRTALEASHPACATKVEGKGCVNFEVRCKAAQEITPDEAARGVTAQLVAAMTFAGQNAGGSSGSAFALFSKSGGAWTRTEAMPVNLSTCAPL